MLCTAAQMGSLITLLLKVCGRRRDCVWVEHLVSNVGLEHQHIISRQGLDNVEK